MPNSIDTFNFQTHNFIENSGYSHFLDIGAGEGKFGKMIRKINKKAKIIGIEPFKPYIDKYKLKDIYDEVLNIKAIDLLDKPEFETELVIMGDVIEHMKKSEAIDFINFMIYRSKKILIILPVAYKQDIVNNNTLESHISVWTDFDFDNFDIEQSISEHNGNEKLIVINCINWR